ncbi:MAG TPA: HAD-IB family phosphatase [Hyphomicrobiaceae bacterium]|nr:HAD-IB family phosphatase [Hyphomicrobiaceae bacterium]
MQLQIGPVLSRAINVYVDFDGTIAPDEPTDQLFEHFADPSWRAIDEAWLAGRMTAWDATAQKVALLRASPNEIHDFLRTMSIDPCFSDFVDLCRAHGIGVTVVSDGLDLVLHTVLAAAGLTLPCKANQLVWRGEDRWAAAFPYRSSACSFRLGNCKCAHRQAGTALDVMVGDGRSDFCIAQRCQLVIAKGSLLGRCQEQALPHIAMRGFADANAHFAAWLSGQPSPASACASYAAADLHV